VYVESASLQDNEAIHMDAPANAASKNWERLFSVIDEHEGRPRIGSVVVERTDSDQ
jgi:hypothetical protein